MVDQIIALMYPLCEAGLISRSHLESIILILRAYAMNLDGLDGENDGSYYLARLLASPAGFFEDRARHEGGVVTAQTLGLTVQHTLVLFAKLNRGVWYRMFTVLGTIGPRVSSIKPRWRPAGMAPTVPGGGF